MASSIDIVAVGDILMWQTQITSASIPEGGFRFDSMFSQVAPHLRAADFTIGNLETTLSGRERLYQKRNPKTGYPRFNCPDELAGALKRAGFDVLTTANNHCMDRGENGLKRTLRILNKHGIGHTGTYVTSSEAKNFLIRKVKGFRIGVLSYTYGTNFIPVPAGRQWMVNRISTEKMIRDLKKLRPQCDLLIVAMHFGQEFQRMPNKRQKHLVRILFHNGADIVLGAHPHVLQPVATQDAADRWGVRKNRLVAYSLGNFVSDRMMGNAYADVGLMLKIRATMDEGGQARIQKVSYLPTWVQRREKGKGYKFKILPCNQYKQLPESSSLRSHLFGTFNRTQAHLRRSV